MDGTIPRLQNAGIEVTPSETLPDPKHADHIVLAFRHFEAAQLAVN